MLLEEFSYKYEDYDIENFWYQKQWPLEIASYITDGSYMISSKEVIFTNKLEQEKENFLKQIEQFKQILEKIKKFSDLNTSNEFATDSYSLRDLLNNAFEKAK